MKETITTKVSEDFSDQVREEALKRNMSVSKFVEMCLREYLKKLNKKIEAKNE